MALLSLLAIRCVIISSVLIVLKFKWIFIQKICKHSTRLSCRMFALLSDPTIFYWSFNSNSLCSVKSNKLNDKNYQFCIQRISSIISIKIPFDNIETKSPTIFFGIHFEKFLFYNWNISKGNLFISNCDLGCSSGQVVLIVLTVQAFPACHCIEFL